MLKALSKKVIFPEGRLKERQFLDRPGNVFYICTPRPRRIKPSVRFRRSSCARCRSQARERAVRDHLGRRPGLEVRSPMSWTRALKVRWGGDAMRRDANR